MLFNLERCTGALVVAVALWSVAGVDGGVSELMRNKRKNCGVRLISVLKKVCNNCYNVPGHYTKVKTKGKRQSHSNGFLELLVGPDESVGRDFWAVDHSKSGLSNDEHLQKKVAFPWESDEEEKELLQLKGDGDDEDDLELSKRWGAKKGRKGLASQCCRRSCSMSELKSFCSEDCEA